MTIFDKIYTFTIKTLKLQHIQIISESSSGRKHQSNVYTTRIAVKYEHAMYVYNLECTVAVEMWRNIPWEEIINSRVRLQLLNKVK